MLTGYYKPCRELSECNELIEEYLYKKLRKPDIRKAMKKINTMQRERTERL